jgi:hypothetical protein
MLMIDKTEVPVVQDAHHRYLLLAIVAVAEYW